MPVADYPYLVRHMALAIYENGYGQGSREMRFWHSLDTARWRLVEYGHLRKGSQYGPPSNIVLTASGKKLEVNHRREQGGANKNRKFKALYERIAPAAEQLPMDRKSYNLQQAVHREGYRSLMEEKKAVAASNTPPPKGRKGTKVRKRTTKAKTRKARTRRVRRRT